MSIEVEAVYEHGVLKLDRPLPFEEHQRVKILVQGHGSVAQQTYGIIGWTGDPEAIRHVALNPEAGVQESA
jgi:predicted DNA-binding antitoxin AbrB/MazE fold protein